MTSKITFNSESRLSFELSGGLWAPRGNTFHCTLILMTPKRLLWDLHFIFFSSQIDRFYCMEDSSHSIHVCSIWKIYHTVNIKCIFKDVLQHINSMNYTIASSNYLYKCNINRISFNFPAKNLYVYFLIWIYPVDVKHRLDIFNSGRWKLYEKIINAMIYSVI